MNYLITMVTALLFGLLVLIIGIFAMRMPGECIKVTFKSAYCWGTAFTVSFASEFVVLNQIF
jgi:hypothetical protein